MSKILLISFSNLPNFQSSIYNTCKNMTKVGQEVYTIGSSNITADGVNLDDRNYCIDVSKNPMPTINSLKLLYSNIKKIIQIINKTNPEYIHFISKHTWNYFLIKAIKNKKRKIIHTFHDPIGHSGEIRRYGVILYNKIISKKVDVIVVHSDKSKYETEKFIKPKCRVIKVPLGEMVWNDYKKNESYKNNILIFGRINPYKGCELIPKIAKELKSRNSNINITIAGKSSKDVKQETINEINNCPNIRFINEFIEDSELEYYFNNSDMVLITHQSITQSGVILQAYRHSKPIIAFDIEGIEEFIERNKTGYLSEPYNEKIYVDNILSLYNRLENLNYFSYNAWEFGKEKFSNQVMSEKLLDVYKKEG